MVNPWHLLGHTPMIDIRAIGYWRLICDLAVANGMREAHLDRR
jgi:hypothetical protein